MSFRVLPQAIADILAIADYIKAENPKAATKLVDQFYKRFRTLGEMPGMGVQRPEISAKARIFWQEITSFLIMRSRTAWILFAWCMQREMWRAGGRH